MADCNDIKWLLKGSKKWNKRRFKCRDWQPDLSNVVISKYLEKGIECTPSGNPDLRGYDFTDADLSGAKLSGADLSNANLSGADLSESELWKAQIPLRGMHVPLPCRINFAKDNKIKSVTDLLTYVEKLGAHYRINEGYEPPILYYRGESEVHPYITPSVMRPTGKHSYRFRCRESELLLELMTRRPDDFVNAPTALAKLMTAQHHRLPTRLLDVTRNPLVALFNATDELKKSGNALYGQLHVLVRPVQW